MKSFDHHFKISGQALARFFAKCRSRFTPRLLTLLLALFAFTPCFSRANDTPVAPSESRPDTDIRLSADTIKALREYRGKRQEAVEKLVMAQPGDFNPPVLYVLSSVLFQQGKKDDAVFWFYAGQLRGRIDAAICVDKSARAVIDALNQKFGPAINQYSLTNLALLTNTVDRVLIWDEKTPCHYDRQWINLQAANTMTGNADSASGAPQNQWEAIRKRTREEFASEFHRALAKFNQRKH